LKIWGEIRVIKQIWKAGLENPLAVSRILSILRVFDSLRNVISLEGLESENAQNDASKDGF
jgi:hypothetical protein